VPGASTRLPSRALSVDGGGRVAVDPRDPNQPRTLEGVFEFDLRVPLEAAVAAFGARMLVRFDHGLEPVGWQAWRRARQLLLGRLQT
jgi:putative peptide zinc metalloprotease protein